MGKLSPASYARMDEKRRELHARLDGLVLDALARLGGRFQGRIMLFRKHLCTSLREAQIKETIKRLAEAGKLRVIGERNSAKGNTYEVIQ